MHRRAAVTVAGTPPSPPAACSLTVHHCVTLPPPQLCTTDRQLTLNTLNELLGLLGAWARGEAYHGAHHLRGAASSLRPVGEGLADLVGNTPLIRLRSLSEATGCEVDGRAVWLAASCC